MANWWDADPVVGGAPSAGVENMAAPSGRSGRNARFQPPVAPTPQPTGRSIEEIAALLGAAPAPPRPPAVRPDPTQSRVGSAARSAGVGFMQVPAALAAAPALAISDLEHGVEGSTAARIAGLERAAVDLAAGIAEGERMGADVTRQQALLQQTRENLNALIEAQGGMAPPRAPTEIPAWQTRDDIKQWGLDTFGAPDPAYAGDFWTDKVATGAGNMAGFMATALPSAALGPAGFLGTAAAGAAVSSDAAFEEAMAGGASVEDALLSSRIMGVVGLSEAAPIISILQRIPGGRGVKAAFVRKIIENAAEEGIQEGFQGTMQNLVARGIYDPERGVFQDVPEQMLIGAILGGGAGAVTGGADLATRPRSTETGPAAPPPPAQPGAPKATSAPRVEVNGRTVDGPPQTAPKAPKQPEPGVAAEVGASFSDPYAAMAQAMSGAPVQPSAGGSVAAPAAHGAAVEPPVAPVAPLSPAAPVAQRPPAAIDPDEEPMAMEVGPDGRPLDQPVPGFWNERTQTWRPATPADAAPAAVAPMAPPAPPPAPVAPPAPARDPAMELAAMMAGAPPSMTAAPAQPQAMPQREAPPAPPARDPAAEIAAMLGAAPPSMVAPQPQAAPFWAADPVVEPEAAVEQASPPAPVESQVDTPAPEAAEETPKVPSAPTVPVADARAEQKARDAREAGRVAAIEGAPRTPPDFLAGSDLADEWRAGYAEGRTTRENAVMDEAIDEEIAASQPVEKTDTPSDTRPAGRGGGTIIAEEVVVSRDGAPEMGAAPNPERLGPGARREPAPVSRLLTVPADPASKEASAWWKTLPAEERVALATEALGKPSPAAGRTPWGFVKKDARARILEAARGKTDDAAAQTEARPAAAPDRGDGVDDRAEQVGATGLAARAEAADDAWVAEIKKAFPGERAGDVRYFDKGKGEPGTPLRAAYDRAKALRDELAQARRDESDRMTPLGQAPTKPVKDAGRPLTDQEKTWFGSMGELATYIEQKAPSGYRLAITGASTPAVLYGPDGAKVKEFAGRPMRADVDKLIERLQRDAPADNQPRPGNPVPLYVERKLTPESAAEIVAWAKEQGFPSTLLPDDLHVTIAYSKAPVDVGDAPARETGRAAKGKSVEPLGDKGAVVLFVDGQDLHNDWQRYRSAGASWDHGEAYRPHITITYDAKGVDLDKVEPFTGAIRLQGETQKALELNRTSSGAIKEQLTGSTGQPRRNTTEAGIELPPEPDRYFLMGDDAETVPIDKLRPVRARPEGIANAGRFMREAFDGKKSRRKPISVRKESDGTYTVLDGNSTYANMKQAGWEKAPVRVMDNAQFARESAPKFVEKIAKDTGVALFVEIGDDGAIIARGFERAREAVEARAAKEGLRVDFRALPEPKPGKPVDLRSMSAADQFAFGDALRQGQPEADIDAALRVAAKHQAAIAAPFAEIAAATGAEASVPSEPKSRDSAVEKIARKGGDARRLTDLPRGGFKVQTPEQAAAVAKMLTERFATVDEGWAFTDAGYFDRKLLLRMDDGMLVEVQLWEPNLLNAKENPTLYPEAGHALYEIARDPEQSTEAKADANRKMLEVYGAALDAASPDWRDLIASSKSGQTAPNRSMNASRDSSGAAKSRTSASVLPSEMDPVKGSRTSVTPESSSTAGSRSQSKNRIGSSSDSDVGSVPDGKANVSPPAVGSNDYGAKNTLVSRDRAAELRARLKAKLDGSQLNAGIDPEIIAIGAELAVYHIEAGARKFADMVRAIAADLDMPTDRLRPYARSWYNGARDMMEDAGLDVADMDGPEAVRSQMAEVFDGADRRGVDQGRGREAGEGDSGLRDEGPRTGEALDDAPAVDGEPAAREEPAAAAGEGAGASQDGSGDRVRQGRDGAERGAGDGGDGVPDAGAGDGADADTRPAARPSRPNYVLDKPERIVGGTPKQRFAKNRAAIEALQTIEQEGREPTQAELDAMAAYTGWGAFGQELFQGSWERPLPKQGWADESQWLRDTLGEKAWKGAQDSIINAHYTDPPTVKAMWGVVEKLGFKGGRVLEPSMGVGNFFSMMPQEIAQASDLTGIELDPTTGAMAKHLFPQANIRIMGYEKSRTPDGFYDLVIGNWPFANVSPADRRYDRLGLSLHNYFFVKALDQTRPGGLVVGVTSRFTMDSQGRQARLEMAKRADLVAAFRLPTGAFEEYAGTAVVTDIIVLRKREAPNVDAAKEAWVNTGTVDVGWPAGEQHINQFYLENPSNVLGKLASGRRTTYGAPGLTVEREDNFVRRLSALPSRVPEGVYQPVIRGREPRFMPNQTTEREGSVVMQAGDLQVVQGERLANLNDVKPWRLKDEAETAARLRQFTDLIEIRRAYDTLIAAERAGAADLETQRRRLKNLHAGFVKAHGPMIDSFALKHLEKVDDPHFATLAALEGPDGKPAAIMDRSTMRPQPSLEKPTVRDAYVLARNENTVIDLARIAEKAGVSEEQARAELIESGAVYATPGGGVEAADVYLSGNVVRKLAEARDAADRGEDMARSIAALEKARPPKVPYFSIEPQLGATWVSVPIHQQFIAEMLGVESADGIDIRMLGGGWRVKLSKALLARPEAKAGFGSADVRFDRLLTAAMGNRPLTIFGRDENNKPVKDDAASKRASEAAQRVREHFNEWAYKDAERRVQMEREYNDTFRAVADPQFDGSFLTFPGLARTFYGGDFDLRQHQRNAVWRGVVNGYGIYAHEVGTGKTATAAAVAVESKRYGKAKKPLLFAHNANSRAVYAEAQGMYPGANMLFIDNLSPKTVKTTLRRIANDDWDLIVMPHSVIDRLSFKEETLRALAQEQIAALEQEALEAAQEDGYGISLSDLDDPDAIKKMRSVTAKELAKQRMRILSQIDKMAGRANRGEDTINFEDLGVDMILVDEAHVFKKPPIATKMQMRGLNTQSSNRSIALQFITDYVKAQRGGTGVHLFTGTPITNTLGEIFHMSRYVIAKDMEAANVSDWDAWFNTFAAASADVEPAAGGGFDIVTRLRKFVNVAELRRMMGTALDVVFADDMPEFKPRTTESGKTMGDESLTDSERDELLNGRSPNAIGRPYKVTVNDIAPITPEQRGWMEQIAAWARAWKSMQGKERLEAMKSGAPESPIIHENIAPKVGLDLRMVEQGAPDQPDSKINRAARRILDHYRESPDGAQVVFAEVGDARESKVAGNTIILDRSPIEDLIQKLVDGGVRRDEIAVVGGGVKPEQKQAIAAKVNRGEVRVVIGKTETLGTGVNMQKRLRAMHHLDAPWMPGQLEQRNGRGWRQGNQWNTVYEYRYITEGIDGARWNVLAVKDRFIQDFKRADDSVREIEGDAVDDAEKADGDSIMATLSEAIGDPRVLQKEKLTKDVERLQRKERLHTEGVVDTKNRARRSREDATRIEREVKDGWAPDAALAEKAKAAEAFEAKIGAKVYKRRADAAEALQREYRRLLPEIMRARTAGDAIKLGEIGGLEIVALKFSLSVGDAAATARDANGVAMAVRGARLHTMGAMSLASAESVIRGIPKKAADRAAEAADLRKSADRLDKMAEAPFALADTLATRKKTLAEIDADLRDNPVAPPMWLRRGAPVDTRIFVRGEGRIVRGHQWAKNGWFVLTDEGPVPYLDARDQYGVRIYQETPFSEPADGSEVAVSADYLLAGTDKTATEQRLDDDGNPIVREQRGGVRAAAITPKMRASLRARLDRAGLKRVALRFERLLSEMGQGAYRQSADGRDAEILIRWAADPEATLDHEIIHALKGLGLFTPQEWAVLEDRARASWTKKHAEFLKAYDGDSEAVRIEEAIAQEYAAALAEKRTPRGLVRAAFHRLHRMLRELRLWWKNDVGLTAEDVFARAEEGRVGRRDGQASAAASRERAEAPDPGPSWNAMRDHLLESGMVARRAGVYRISGLESPVLGPLAIDARTGTVEFMGLRRPLYGDVQPRTVKWADLGYNDRMEIADLVGLNDAASDAFARATDAATRGAPDADALAERANAYVREQRALPNGTAFVPSVGVSQAISQTAGTLAPIRAGMSPSALQTTLDNFRTALQDKFLPVLRAQQAIEESTGAPLPEHMRPYLIEETYTGRVGEGLDEIDRGFIEPVLERITRSKGLSVESVGQYLAARHAEERNQHIAGINPKLPDGGAGADPVTGDTLTTAYAQQLTADMEAGPDGAALQEIAALVDDWRDRTIQRRVDMGLMSKTEAASWRKKYAYYVPLKGFAETDHADAALDLSGMGRGYNTRGQETRRALGRESAAFNPLIGAFAQAQEVVIRSEKNRVGQALYELAAAHPSEALFTVKKVKNVRYFNGSTGLVETRAESPVTMMQAKNEIAVKVGGEEKRIVVHDQRILDAITGMGGDRLSAFTRLMRGFTQFQSMMNTMFSPPFILVNAVRDIMTASIQSRMLAEGDAKGIMAEVRKNYLSALKGAWGGVRGRSGTQWERNYRDYAKAGGKISFWKIEQPEEMARALERRVRLRTGKATISDRAVLWQKAWVIEAVEHMNLAIDNAMRLAAFKAARDRGWSPERAASLAKNLTVNFNRRGAYGSAINAYVMFFNAGMQGFHLVARSMGNKRTRRLLYAAIALGLVEDTIMSALSGEDDDGELAYDKIPAWKRAMSLVLMAPGGDGGITVPLPYGYNAFMFMGKQAGRLARGAVEPGQAMQEMATAFVETVAPPVEPTLYRPWVAYRDNRNWFDAPIRPEWNNETGPNSAKAYAGTTNVSKAIASWLNTATGGSDFHSGAIDIAPGYIDWTADWIAGGVGRVGRQAISSVDALVQGEPPEWKDVPIASRFGFSTGIWLDRDAYYQRRQKVRDALAVAKEGGPQALRDRDRALVRLDGVMKETERLLREVRKQRREMGDLTLAQRRAFERREQAALDRFNRAFLQATRGG